MKIRYTGPFPTVQIAATGQTVERGASVDVDTAVARELLKQATWKKVTVKKKD